jgi:potassium-transporting ATPase KdpC subunit
MRAILASALRVSLVTWVLCGLVYPLAVTALAQWLMPYQANGSLEVDTQGQVIGSHLIGQQWDLPRWFHGRPSATTAPDPADTSKTIAAPYSADNSAASNLGPSSRALFERLMAAHKSLEEAEPELNGKPVPADMLTTSASGLDPDISPANAALQAARVASARGVPVNDIQALIARHMTGRSLGIFGEPRVNVFELNMALGQVYER